jgi:hypothetical protein
VKFEAAESFSADFRRLRPEHQRAFRSLMPDFSAACDEYARTAGYVWPKFLRVSRLRGTADVWEMTWSFAGPDGRATFQFVRQGDDLACRWRRGGDHSVFKDP